MSGPRSLPASTARRADQANLVLAIVLAIWAAMASGGRSTPIVLLLAGLVGSAAVGRRLAAWPELVPKAVAAAVAGAFALTYPGVLGAGGAPTGYANSNATLASLGALAAAAAAQGARPGPERRAWTGLTLVLALTVLLTRSTAGILAFVVAGALVAVALRWRWAPLVAAGGAILMATVLALTVAMAVDASTPLAGSDLVRVELWSAAAELAREEPVRGLGGGAFEARNPVTQDADLRWAHHEYLEVTVELGGVGLLLVVSLGLTTMIRLATAGMRGTVGAAALTVVAVHGTVDHVWHAPAILLVTALLVGDATGDRNNPVRPAATLGGGERGEMGPKGHCR